MREVIATDGRHYRLHPSKPHIVQVQDQAPPYRWRTWFTAKTCMGLDEPGFTAEDRASAMLASIGKLNEAVTK